nr:unnamed protein product [Haemonchus contortus]
MARPEEVYGAPVPGAARIVQFIPSITSEDPEASADYAETLMRGIWSQDKTMITPRTNHMLLVFIARFIVSVSTYRYVSSDFRLVL